MPKRPLNTSASVVLNASGAGTASIGPDVGQHWTLGNIAVIVSTAVLEPVCTVYTNAVAPGNIVDKTYSGSGDSTDSARGIVLGPGQKVFAVWSGGDVGATATVSIFGDVETR